MDVRGFSFGLWEGGLGVGSNLGGALAWGAAGGTVLLGMQGAAVRAGQFTAGPAWRVVCAGSPLLLEADSGQGLVHVVALHLEVLVDEKSGQVGALRHQNPPLASVVSLMGWGGGVALRCWRVLAVRAWLRLFWVQWRA